MSRKTLLAQEEGHEPDQTSAKEPHSSAKYRRCR
jgi:hypothetical protein